MVRMNKQASLLYDNLICLSWYFNGLCCSGSQHENLAMVDLLTLKLIHNCPESPIQIIGTTLGITKSGATRVVQRLEKQNLVAINISPDDARVRCLSLTSAGLKTIKEVTQRQTGHLQTLLESMDKDEVRQLTSGINALKGSLGKAALGKAALAP